MSLTTESNTKVLSDVAILEETASSRVNLIINDNGVIKQYNLNAHIMGEISNLKESVGADKTETSTSTGLYLQLENINNDIIQLDSVINGTESEQGLNNIVTQLQEDFAIQQNKKVFEGYNAQFIESSDNINLLAKNSIYNFPLPLNDLSLANCIKSGSGYEVNLHFNIQYQKKDTEYYLYNTAVINLNVGDSVVTASKNIALYLPVVNTTILLEITVTGNNLRMEIKDCIAATEVKDNGIANIEYGAIEIKKVNFIDTTQGSTDTGGNNNTNIPEVLSIPLTLCFDQRDALNSNDSSQILSNLDMLYGSKIKFNHTDIQQGASMTVKYGSGQTTYILDPNNINTQIKYIGNSLSSRGNILTLNESGDLLPTPQIIYLNADQSVGFGTKEGTWFKYWPNNGQITTVTFNNYNYNGGVGHQIQYIVEDSDERVEIDGVNYVRIDNFCIPYTQWQAFFTTNDKYTFNLSCTNTANQVAKLTSQTADNTSNIIIKSNNNIIIRALNYIDTASNNSPVPGVKPGIYLRADMKTFVISVE